MGASSSVRINRLGQEITFKNDGSGVMEQTVATLHQRFPRSGFVIKMNDSMIQTHFNFNESCCNKKIELIIRITDLE